MSIPVEKVSSFEERLSMLRGRFADAWPGSDSADRFLVTVPLRVCPLGAHSDHQGGIVTGLTIDRTVQLLGERVSKPVASVRSANFDGECSFSFDNIAPKVSGEWGNYLRGAVKALVASKGGLAHGFRGILHGAMPIGGLSSSAAVTIAYLKALEYVNGIESSNLETVMLVRAVENGYLGLHNGILDQSVIVSGKRDALTVIDCSSHTISSLPQHQSAPPWEIMVVYSGLSRQLTSTPFNQRVAECHEAARQLLTMGGRPASEKPLLGEAGDDLFEEFGDRLPEHLRRRATHFFTERARVREGMTLWSQGDMVNFGALVTASGESSIVNYEAGSPALISLYEILASTSGVYGSRFCGGGFQGCCLALVDPPRRDEIAASVHEAYGNRHPELLDEYSIHFCRSSDSVSVETVL
jgi:galactokinase